MDIIGKRPAGNKVGYLSAIELTPWQVEQLLEVCVSVQTENYEHNGRSCVVGALGVNYDEIDAVMEVVKRENICILKEEDETFDPEVIK